MLARRSVLVLALILAVATCLRSPAHGRAAPRIHRSRPSRPGRLPPPRAELNVFDEINEEARGSWLSRFLPGGERSEQREMISEQPVLFTKMDAIGEPVFDYDRWAVHRSADRYNPNPSPSPSPNPNQVDAAVFLAARVAAAEQTRQFTMVDVLRAGAM